MLTIKSSLPEAVQQFREQEVERYKNSEKAFMYSVQNVKSVVAPLRRGPGNPTTKAREHFLLKPDRPPHVNLLCLVRDAASRLPGCVGTRPDVALLLKDSQYIVSSVTDSQINSVVSGALDRLHSEKDPCVRFDGEQKLWIYLHRSKRIEDFVELKPKASRPSNKNGPPHKSPNISASPSLQIPGISSPMLSPISQKESPIQNVKGNISIQQQANVQNPYSIPQFGPLPMFPQPTGFPASFAQINSMNSISMNPMMNNTQYPQEHLFASWLNSSNNK